MDCNYCQKGKALNKSKFKDMEIKTYIHGNLLITEVYDYMSDVDDYCATKINVCPICKEAVHELEDEEMEEEKDD